MKKAVKISLLSVVLLVPCLWYLFLQFFGENEFSLSEYGALSEICEEMPGNFSEPVLLAGMNVGPGCPNEWDRVERYLELTPFGVQFSQNCLDSLDLILVDGAGIIRGKYTCTREDIDRLLIELDIFLKYEYDGKQE